MDRVPARRGYGGMEITGRGDSDVLGAQGQLGAGASAVSRKSPGRSSRRGQGTVSSLDTQEAEAHLGCMVAFGGS